MSTEPEMLKAAQPQSRRVRLADVGGDLELSYRQRSGCGACFLLLWLTAWSTGCVMLLHQVIQDPGIFSILFATPFVASWFFVFGLLLWMLFGLERVRLGFEGLEYRATALLPLSRRWVPRVELKGVSASVTSYQVNGQSLACLKFETLGRPLLFARGISEKEQRWLIEWLNKYLKTLGPQRESNRPTAASSRSRKASRREGLHAQASPVEPPSDSRIELRDREDTIEFVWRGEWGLAAVAGTTFLQLFWNGVVGVFVYQLIRDFQWFLFVFLLPFEALGLVFFAVWFIALTGPAWRLTWTFGEREIARRISGFGIGWTKRWHVQPPVRIGLQASEEGKRAGSLWVLLSHPDGEYDLSFIGGENKELLAINRLTEGDARWMAGVLLRAFPSWSQNERPILT